jgi:hypothetical protein
MSEISPAEIREVVTREDDFGHEMRVGEVLRCCSNAVLEHGGTYTDPISEKPRQFDYRCWVTFQRTRLVLSVECKNITPDFPLVVCGARRSENDAFHDLIESRQGRFDEGNLIHTGLSSVTRRVSADNIFYPKNEFVGKSLLRIQLDKMTTSRSGESEIYDRWAQSLSSAVEMSASATSAAKHLSETSVFTAVLPFVVIPDGTLWRAVYDNTGRIIADPARVEECAYFVGREIEAAGPKGIPWFQTFTFSHVHFVTLSGLQKFLSTAISGTPAWSNIFVERDKTVRVSAAYPRDPANL